MTRVLKKYSLEKDHSSIKKQIKKWEKEIDKLNKKLRAVYMLGQDNFEEKYKEDPYFFLENYHDTLEAISHEMMAINI